jgi:plasmid stabilization system protein ParE
LKVVWTRGALDDATALVLQLHDRSPGASRRLAEQFALAGERLADFPRMGMPADGEGHYSILVAHGRFRMSYRIDPDAVRILGLSWAAARWSNEAR